MGGRGKGAKSKADLEKELARTQTLLENLQKKQVAAQFDDEDEGSVESETRKGG